jgi:4-amino-4-deoxy-L-arabinose transferase-like glycosyltransferase
MRERSGPPLQPRSLASPPAPTAWALLLAIAAIPLAVHLLTAGNYGIFRDEYYYLACARHLAWGYVDHPPLSMAVLALVRTAAGEGILALRIFPALCASALVLLARWADETSPRLMLWLGIVLGLGLMNKLGVLILGDALALALLLTPLRRKLLPPAPYLGGAVALLIFSPHVLWQMTHGWPTLEFMANARKYKVTAMSPPDFLGEVVLEQHPFNLLIWTAGLGWLLFAAGACGWEGCCAHGRRPLHSALGSTRAAGGDVRTLAGLVRHRAGVTGGGTHQRITADLCRPLRLGGTGGRGGPRHQDTPARRAGARRDHPT